MPGRSAAVLAVLWAVLLTGCAGDALPSVSGDHPANVEAPRAPVYPDSGVLAVEEPPPDPIPPEMKRPGAGEHAPHGTHGKEEERPPGARHHAQSTEGN
jgi:hypothetical protein